MPPNKAKEKEQRTQTSEESETADQAPELLDELVPKVWNKIMSPKRALNQDLMVSISE